MRRGECPSFERCSAPLCPLDAESVARGVWYADEPVCAAHGRRERWLAVQRRVAKRTGGAAGRGYFTVAMLLAARWVTRKIKGISPNPVRGTLEEYERSWIAARTRQRAPFGRAPERSFDVAGQIGISGHVGGADDTATC